MEALSSHSHQDSFSSHSPYDEDGLCQKRKRKLVTNPCCCPACGVTVRPGEWATHYAQELDRVCKLKLRQLSKTGPSEQGSSSTSSKMDTERRWSTYIRVKGNRQMRLRIKNRKQNGSEVTCPVCNKNIHGTAEELNQHVEGCLNQQDSATEDEEVDVEGNETYEEYEWAGQCRIRASTLIPGGFAALGMATSRSTNCAAEEEEEKVVVDVDDSVTYGAPQYTEADIVMVSADDSVETSDNEAIRNALINVNSGNSSAAEETIRNGTEELMTLSQNKTEKEATKEAGLLDVREGSQNPVIEVLKTKIKRLEGEINCGSDRRLVCLICMDSYKKPVVSISCWHVHCEECWLHTLGAKKLCPQCNMITSPADLRRIYL